MEKSKVAIIIPAYNEKNTIGRIVNKLKNIAQVIVVDDASSDDTSKIAKKNGAYVIRNKINLGYDASINKGFKIIKKKKYKIFFTFDADNQFDTKDIKKIIKQYSADYGILIGQRNKISRFSEKVFSFYTKIKYSINDPLCGLKCYNLEKCRNEKKFDRYNSIGTDLMFRIIKKSKLKNISINLKKRNDKPRFGSLITSNFKIFRSLIFLILFYDK